MEFQSSRIPPVPVFKDMSLNPAYLAALEKIGIVTPTAIQSETIPAALTGVDLVGVAQTGSGKTLAYALAILTQLEKNPEGRALVLTPSRETAEQVHRTFADIVTDPKMSLCLVATGSPTNEQEKALRKNPRIIIASPGRLVDHLQGNKLLLQKLAVLVIDEADRMLDMGFEPQFKFIQSTLRGERQTLMFAATFGAWAKPVAKLFMKPDAILVRTAGAEAAVETLQQSVFFLNQGQKNNRLLDELKKMKGNAIIFADSKENCVAIGRFLDHHKFASEFMHGDMNPGHRNRVLREFREEKVTILVTTDLLARGLDVAHVKYVVNFDLPYKPEDFLHRIGRTARAGRDGFAITFVTPGDDRTYRKIKAYLAGAKETKLNTDFKFEDVDRTGPNERPTTKPTKA